ncbi:hypothetical protein KP509_27G018600 [Ceratopteris richardii]|uniref:DCD domain-containing protein n=1 Tax=Ceratopteris richardii TaxID=49495 RepID=A0A8T2RGV0_CERRI|nr:hypothetical protein KP509_27G018600 [Ceratopteris richardii]
MNNSLIISFFACPRLQASHIIYVKNVRPGMPLFFFNYIDKKLHGISEADSYGEMNINPYTWTDGKQKTRFSARVLCLDLIISDITLDHCLRCNEVLFTCRHAYG